MSGGEILKLALLLSIPLIVVIAGGLWAIRLTRARRDGRRGPGA